MSQSLARRALPAGPATRTGLPADRRRVLQWTAALAATSSAGLTGAQAQVGSHSASPGTEVKLQADGVLRPGMISFMLAHEQFPVPEVVEIGAAASQAGFRGLCTSDHLQPWQANEGHAGFAWVTMGALGARAQQSWMGTTVTCPTLRYNPAVVAEAFASLSLLYPGRIFLGVGSGEALNEQAATGVWPKWQERWDRLIEAIGVIRALWQGQPVSHQGKYYQVNAKLYDPPARPIPLLTAANGKKSMKLAGLHGDGLITDPETWQKHKGEWQAGARQAGKDPDKMPVLVEAFAFVGTSDQAGKAAQLWRFLPQAFKKYYNDPDPTRIEQQASTQVPMQKVMQSWTISPDAKVHAQKIRELFDSGVSIVNIHSAQADQRAVIRFYGEHVLPQFNQPA